MASKPKLLRIKTDTGVADPYWFTTQTLPDPSICYEIPAAENVTGALIMFQMQDSEGTVLASTSTTIGPTIVLIDRAESAIGHAGIIGAAHDITRPVWEYAPHGFEVTVHLTGIANPPPGLAAIVCLVSPFACP